MQNEEQLEIVATMLASSYWRGYLDSSILKGKDLEKSIEVLVETSKHLWNNNAELSLKLLKDSQGKC